MLFRATMECKSVALFLWVKLTFNLFSMTSSARAVFNIFSTFSFLVFRRQSHSLNSIGLCVFRYLSLQSRDGLDYSSSMLRSVNPFWVTFSNLAKCSARSWVSRYVLRLTNFVVSCLIVRIKRAVCPVVVCPSILGSIFQFL